MLKAILKNPLTIWMNWLWHKVLTERRNKNLRLGYMSRAVNCRFGANNVIYDDVLLSSVSLGDLTYVSNGCRLQNTTVGKFACIGPDVLCGLGRHPSRDFVSVHPAFYSPLAQGGITFVSESLFEEYAPIVIGNDVWIGARAIILDGVVIGNGAIVGAGAVVTSSVPPYAVVAGAPARVMRYRFTPEQINLIESSKWWDWDLALLRERYPSFQDVETWEAGRERQQSSITRAR
jgi:acetyltransferase-like isoleucine patch superfamily enzyme